MLLECVELMEEDEYYYNKSHELLQILQGIKEELVEVLAKGLQTVKLELSKEEKVNEAGRFHGNLLI